MFSWLSKIISPPKLSDPEKAKLAEFFSTLVYIAIIASFVYAVIIHTFIDESIIPLSIPLLVFLSGGVSITLLRTGRLNVAIYVFALSVWLTFTVTSVLLFGGLTSPTIGLYVLIIIAVGLMLGVKPAIFFAGITFGILSLMYLGEMLKIMPVPLVSESPLRTLFVHVINIVMTAVLVRQAVRDINKSREQAEARAQELENFIASMEATIAKRTYEIGEQKKFFETLFNNIPVAVVSVDPDNKIVACNQSFEELFGYQQSEILGRELDMLVTTEETLAEAEKFTRLTQNGTPTKSKCRRNRKDGSFVDVEMRGVPVFMNDKHVGALGIYLDITARLLAEDALKADEAKFRSLFEDSPISLWEEDFSSLKDYLDRLRQNGISDFRIYFDEHPDEIVVCAKKVKILNVNQETVSLLNYKSKEELFTNVSEVLSESSMDAFKEELIALAENNLEFACEIHQKKSDGETIIGDLRLSIAPGYEDTWKKVFVSIIDITERKRAEEELRYLSFHDALTGVYNRAYFDEEMERWEFGRQFPVSIIACDLDNLKQINDTLGHDAGDKAIKAAATILAAIVRQEDVVARIGGDEFAIILPNVDLNENSSILERLEGAITKFNIIDEDDGQYRPISLTYGFATIPHGASLIKGYKLADEQLYANKTRKKQN